MQGLARALLTGTLLLIGLELAHAQSPNKTPLPNPRSQFQEVSNRAQNPSAVTNAAGEDQNRAAQSIDDELETRRRQLDDLRRRQGSVQDPAQLERLQKQMELQQKQIETLEQMVRLLAEQLQKQPAPAVAVEQLQADVAAMQARSLQGARRDRELADAVDNLVEKADAERRYGPSLPAPLKELFLPSQTNESPLSIFGAITAGYTDFQEEPGEFEFEEFAPFFLLQLNERMLLESEIEFGLEEVEVSQAQLDFIVNDWLTVVGGRFLAPIGFFNERLHPDWINKLPDFPLMFRQVSPADFSLNGLQLRGSHYLGASPVKLEYAFYVTNGLGLDEEEPELTELANLDELKETSEEVNNDKAFGGRIGFWIPENGLTAGVSAFFNGAYTPEADDDITLWQIDAGYRKGNWDLRFEYAQMFQEAGTFIDDNIHRRGLYAQAAYRPYDACCKYLQNTEVVFRYSYANFNGIDPKELELDEFATLVDVPVDRNQYTLGLNYYIYPSLVLKFAYEINEEVGDIDLDDNVFMMQMAWGF